MLSKSFKNIPTVSKNIISVAMFIYAHVFSRFIICLWASTASVSDVVIKPINNIDVSKIVCAYWIRFESMIMPRVELSIGACVLVCVVRVVVLYACPSILIVRCLYV